MEMSISGVHNYLERYGIKCKIKRNVVWSGSNFFETDEIILKNGNKSITIEPWSLKKVHIHSFATKIKDEKNYEHIITHKDLVCDNLSIGTCISYPKGHWPQYDSHVENCKTYDELLHKYIIGFLELLQQSKEGELFEQQSLF